MNESEKKTKSELIEENEAEGGRENKGDKKYATSNEGKLEEDYLLERPEEKEKEKEKEKEEEDINNEDNDHYLNNENKKEKNIKKSKKNTTVSTFSPAYITEPIYQWEVSSNDRIFYDKANDFVIHQNASTKALLVTDIKNTEANYNGVYAKFDRELCEHICFNLNGTFFLYYCINPNKIEISDILSNHNIYLNVEINKLNEYEILSVFWLNDPVMLKNKQTNSIDSSGNSCINNNNTNNSGEFVVVTNCTIEIFEIIFDSLTVQPLKKHFLNSQYCWHDDNSSYIVLLSNKNHVLLPYLLTSTSAIKLPKIELNIPKKEKINYNEIQIITLYNETYCIHKDHKNGRISLRCLSSTFYYDYVVDLFCNGVLDIATVDNLLIVFNNSNEKVYLFDIFQKKNETENTSRNSLTGLNSHTINVTYLTNPKNFKTQINFSHITFHSFNVLMDNHFGNLYKIGIDYNVLMLQICQHYSNLNTSIDVLLRRPNCKDRVTEMIFLSLENDIKIEDFLSIVHIINLNYRKLVEQVAKKNSLKNAAGNAGNKSGSGVVSNATTQGGINSGTIIGNKMDRKVTQLLDNLLKHIEDKTLITERDIVINVFHPYMIKRYNLKKKETLFNFSINFRQLERNKKMQKKKYERESKKEDEKYMLKYKIKKKKDEQSDLTFDSNTNSPNTDAYHKEEKEEKNDDICYSKNQKEKDQKEKDQKEKNQKEKNQKEKDQKEKDQKEKNQKGEQLIPQVETTHNMLDDNLESDYNINFIYADFKSVPLFLVYVLEYMKSLLHLNILPNRILQTFIFDLCIFFKQDNCLRQLLQFYTISDSVEITKRLFHFWKLTQHKWAFQFCLDMSLRLKEYEMIIHLFLCSKQYLKVMNFLRKYNLVDYPILVVLQTIENDFDILDKYIIMNNVLQSLSHWIEDSQRDPIKYPMPNLQNCQKWFELVEET